MGGVIVIFKLRNVKTNNSKQINIFWELWYCLLICDFGSMYCLFKTKPSLMFHWIVLFIWIWASKIFSIPQFCEVGSVNHDITQSLLTHKQMTNLLNIFKYFHRSTPYICNSGHCWHFRSTPNICNSSHCRHFK